MYKFFLYCAIVTCHGCRLKGNCKSDCPKQEKTILSKNAKLAKINLVQIVDEPLTIQEEL